MSEENQMTGGQMFVLICVVLFILGALFGGGGSSSSTSTTSTNSGSANYRYAKERFRQEGFSDSDASEAASAVIKFHEAQKAQRGY
jgi:hypothetical protein